MVLQYGPLRTPPRCASGCEDDDSEGGQNYGEAREIAVRFLETASVCLRRCCRCSEPCRRLGTAGWLDGWLSKATRNRVPPKMRDTEAGGRSPGLQWRATLHKDVLPGLGLMQQRRAALVWVALFFSVPLATFFVGKNYFGDVAAGVSAAVLLQLIVIIYAVCSAQAMTDGGSGLPRKNR